MVYRIISLVFFFISVVEAWTKHYDQATHSILVAILFTIWELIDRIWEKKD